MKEPCLEVTFWRGRPVAAYYYLPRWRISFGSRYKNDSGTEKDAV